MRRGAAVVHRSDTPSLTVGGGHTAPGDSDYPVSARWELHDGDAHALVRLRREWLRWDPFDIIPQPFRLLLSLQAQPQRVWADADFELRLPAHPGGAPVTAEGIGVAAVTFARPVDRDQ